jgi:probable DNA repair protein
MHNATGQPSVVIASDDATERERIAQWCARKIASRPDARLLVILPGGAGARERLATLIRQSVDPSAWFAGDRSAASSDDLVSIEGGAPLADIPMIAHALATLKWLSGGNGEFEELSEWLRAPYWDSPGEGPRARIDLWLRETGRLSLRGGDWVPLLRSAPAPVAEAAQELAFRLESATWKLRPAGMASPRDWSERFREALDVIGWPGQRTGDSGQQQTTVRLRELLDEFGQLASSARAMPCEEAVHWLSELAARTPFRPADSDAVVTISPTLADPVVLYDAIWVAGLHAEVFPQPVQPDPFLPLSAQIAAGLANASATGRLSEARSLLESWRIAAPELVLSAPARAGDLELLPSPLLAQWLGAPEAAHADPPLWLPYRMHRSDRLEAIEDSVGVPWPAGQPLPSGTRSLELQNLCAFRAYAELRLGTSELGVPEPGVAPDVRGRLLHSALQILWGQLGDSRSLADRPPEQLDALIERCVDEAALTILGDSTARERPPVLARECRRAARLIKALCALERSRDSFEVEDTEFERSLTLAGAQLTVRIDRLDSLESGGKVILDYKSGRRTPADWYGERPSHPQLLAYQAAIGSEVIAMATVNVTGREIRFEGIASSSGLLPKVKGVEGPGGEFEGDAWETRTSQWRARLEGLAAAFLAGRATVDPKPGACDYCHAIGLCRISDRRIEAAAAVLADDFDRNVD